jgi:hypothetical protein
MYKKYRGGGHAFRKGDDVQKFSVIESLPQLLAEDAHSCITRVLPKIQQSLPTASAEFHMAAAVIFKQVLEQRLVSNSTFTEVFLQSILSSLDSREPGKELRFSVRAPCPRPPPLPPSHSSTRPPSSHHGTPHHITADTDAVPRP